MRTNKNCPGYGEDLDAHVENSGMERTSGKLNLHDSSAQPKSTIKKIIPKIAARNAPAEASEKIEKTKTFQLKVKCGLPDKPLEQITAATQSSDKQDEMGNRTISKYSKITVSNKMKPEDFHGEPQKQSSIVIHPPLDIEKQPWRKIIIKQLKVDQVKEEVHDGIQEEHRKIDKMMQSSYEILRKQEKKRFDDAAKRKAEDDKKFWEEENKRGLIREAKERERERPAVESSAWYGPEHCPQTKLHRGGEGQTGWLIPRSGGARLRLPKDGEASHVAKKSRVDDRVYAYGECQKNHAAATGGYALDGCGEFTHGGEQGTIEFLQCGACGCHRNLHRYL